MHNQSNVYQELIQENSFLKRRIKELEQAESDHKQIEVALKESTRQLADIIEFLPDPIFAIDLSRTIIAWNYAMEELTGVKAEDMLGKGHHEYSVLLRGAYKPLLIEQAMGVAVVDEKNFDFVKKEGDVLIAEAELTLRGKSLTIWGKAAPLRDSQGNVVGAIQSFHDITAPKQAEEALKQSLRQIDTLFGLLPGYAFFKDANLRYVRLSERACEFLGRPLKDIIGKNDFDLFPKQYAKKIREDDMKVLESGEPLLVDNEENIENEKIVILSTCKVPIKDEDGKVVGLIGLAIDITERKRAEDTLKERTQQLEDANKELESFSYSVSHDLKAPLRAIDGYARMLVKKYGHSLDEDAARMVNIIRDNTERMGLLIDDLLSFSRVLKSGIAISEINMDKLVREVWAEIQAANTERDLEFKIINALPGKGDPTLIRQVLINLLSNAVKFTKTKKPGIIEMNSYTERGKIVYCIKDNGVGFEMEYYNKLFGVFQRLHSNEEYEGTGIGLAIVHRIISRHGGRIWAEGKVDKGATLFFTLPT